MGTMEKVLATAKLFTELAAKVKAEGMRVGYHAHGGDFKKIDGQTAWDIFFANAAPEVIMQLDIGNCMDGGGDPYAMLAQVPRPLGDDPSEGTRRPRARPWARAT